MPMVTFDGHLSIVPNSIFVDCWNQLYVHLIVGQNLLYSYDNHTHPFLDSSFI
jgi:hypothetical protein